ncbi:MAG: glycosyltransferase [Variovorax sp.]|nr:glycosyltransferase [Variovorax sp.]
MLAQSGRQQSILFVETPDLEHNVRLLTDTARLVAVGGPSSRISRWMALSRVCLAEIRRGELSAVHAHGIIPCILASVIVRSEGARVPIMYTPHGSRSLGTLRHFGKLAMLLARPFVRPGRSAAIVTVPREKADFRGWANTELIEAPVHQAYFDAARKPPPNQPLIITGGRRTPARSADIFAQLAVVLSAEELGLRFEWLGAASSASQLRLAAASVSLVPVDDDPSCADHMARGWLYVAPWFTRGFPLFLVQAMAAGLPCVALDCEQHREVIEDGLTGFLCATEQEMVRRIAQLVDDKSIRSRMGQAARDAVALRFSEEEFARRLLSTYRACTQASASPPGR